MGAIVSEVRQMGSDCFRVLISGLGIWLCELCGFRVVELVVGLGALAMEALVMEVATVAEVTVVRVTGHYFHGKDFNKSQ